MAVHWTWHLSSVSLSNKKECHRSISAQYHYLRPFINLFRLLLLLCCCVIRKYVYEMSISIIILYSNHEEELNALYTSTLVSPLRPSTSFSPFFYSYLFIYFNTIGWMSCVSVWLVTDWLGLPGRLSPPCPVFLIVVLTLCLFAHLTTCNHGMRFK